MKISKVEKEKSHRRIIEAAVKVITKKGFRAATMRDIAKEAKIADATIYKYFPTKESILFSYFELSTEKLVDKLKSVKDFNKYNFQEQLHLLIETQLEIFEKDRAFINIAYENLFLTNWLNAASASGSTKARFSEVLEELVSAAVEVGEFPEPPFKKLLFELFWEYAIGIAYYWLRDDSEKYQNTTQLIDRSLGIIVACLKSGVLGKLTDLAHFLVREHLLSKIKSTTTKERGQTFEQVKRRFMGVSPS